MKKHIRLSFNNLRFQLVLCYFVVSILALSAGAFLICHYTAKTFTENNAKHTLQEFKQSENNIENILNEVDRLSSMFMQSSEVQQMLQATPKNSDYEMIQMQNGVIDRITEITQNYDFVDSVYLFTDGGKVVGSSYRNTYIDSMPGNKDEFQKSDLHRNALAAFPKQVLGSCIPERLFNPNLPAERGNTRVIPTARVVRSFLQPARSGTLVFNIDEKYLASFYNGGTGLNNGSLFIMDRSGAVVSSQSEKLLGEKSPLRNRLTLTKSYESLTMDENDVSMQVVYYQIKNTDWFLVDQIPLQELQADSIRIRRIIVVISVIGLFVILLVSALWVQKMTKPLDVLSRKMSDVSSGKLGVTLQRIPKNEIGSLIQSFNAMSVSIKDLVLQNQRMQEEKMKLEIDALQAQINPHFIYNTLNMIKWMATMIRATNIEKSIVALGNLLEPAFREKGQMWVLGEELRYLENYMKIMNWRFGNTLSFQLSVPESLSSLYIPKFILQPIVENSVVHGLQDQTKINVCVKTALTDGSLMIEVSDNGSGIQSEKQADLNRCFQSSVKSLADAGRETVGLLNVNRRIKLNFGDAYGLEIRSAQPQGTVTKVTLPYLLSAGGNSQEPDS